MYLFAIVVVVDVSSGKRFPGVQNVMTKDIGMFLIACIHMLQKLALCNCLNRCHVAVSFGHQ